MHITVMEWHPHSPDSNPIEPVWFLLKGLSFQPLRNHPNAAAAKNFSSVSENVISYKNGGADALTGSYTRRCESWRRKVNNYSPLITRFRLPNMDSNPFLALLESLPKYMTKAEKQTMTYVFIKDWSTHAVPEPSHSLGT